MYKDRLSLGIVALVIALSLFLGASTILALSKQSAAAPGEALEVDKDETTAIKMAGVFAVEVTSTGIGTIQIKRSEDGSTNWMVVKTLTNTTAGDQRKYLYETFGDTDRSLGAYYKAYLSGNPTSGTFRVRFVK
jgi:hypothetical protein